MIKNLEKDLRTYRKDTFITSFFATITILLIVLIICSVPSNAQSVTGSTSAGSYEYDTDDYEPINEIFDIDLDTTSPTGLLARDLNDNINVIGGTEQNPIYNLYSDSNYYLFPTQDTNNNLYTSCVSYLDGSMNLPTTFTVNGSVYELKDYPYFCYVYYGDRNYFYLSEDDTFYSYPRTYLANNTGGFLFVYQSGGWQIIPTSSYTMNLSGYGLGEVSSHFLNTSGYARLVYSNAHVLGLEQTIDNNNTSLIGMNIELNYLHGQTGNGSGGSDGGETPENNMYLKSADFKFNIHKYGDIDNNDSTADNVDFAQSNMVYKNYWGNKSGLIDFECVPTDYQIDHAEEFYLYFQFNLIQRFDALSPAFNSEPNLILYPFKSHSINTTTTTSFYNKIYFDDLIEDSNRVTWRIDDLFNDLTITACNVPYLTGVTNNDSFTSAVAQERELGGVIWKNDNNLGYIIQCYAFLGCDTDTLTDAGSYSETYGFCSQVSKNTDDSITTNPNPYVPSDDTDSDGKPDSSQTVVNDGNVSLINNNYDNDNNNQTVNITSDDAELVDTLTDKFIPSNMDNTGGLTTQFTELANTNGYITFFKNTFSFVPVAVWNTLLVLLGTTCSIIAVAFVIKVLRGM